MLIGTDSVIERRPTAYSGRAQLGTASTAGGGRPEWAAWGTSQVGGRPTARPQWAAGRPPRTALFRLALLCISSRWSRGSVDE